MIPGPRRLWFYPGGSLVLSSHVQRGRGLSQLHHSPHLGHGIRRSEEAKKGVLGVLFSENKVLEIWRVRGTHEQGNAQASMSRIGFTLYHHMHSRLISVRAEAGPVLFTAATPGPRRKGLGNMC